MKNGFIRKSLHCNQACWEGPYKKKMATRKFNKFGKGENKQRERERKCGKTWKKGRYEETTISL